MTLLVLTFPADRDMRREISHTRALAQEREDQLSALADELVQRGVFSTRKHVLASLDLDASAQGMREQVTLSQSSMKRSASIMSGPTCCVAALLVMRL